MSLDFKDHITGLTKKDQEELIAGQQSVELEIRSLALEQENKTLGRQVVDIDIRLMMGGL